ncbi:hypothetical protein F2Q69_00007065 [Brassica cretica]|uniref:Uncharacterized protein n=1 Tax=Brassica cretica TaxID=69181 RepID=A0A8S9P8C9_BRACR|nr:hypothetical protein F2Q69_00007065 [Brassica cretica]
MRTSGFPDDLQVLTRPPGYENNLQTPRVHILNILKPPGSEPISQILAVTFGFLGYLLVPATQVRFLEYRVLESMVLEGAPGTSQEENRRQRPYFEDKPNTQLRGPLHGN